MAQKTNFSTAKVATNFFGVSGDLTKSFGSGITFRSITFFFGPISTSYDWPTGQSVLSSTSAKVLSNTNVSDTGTREGMKGSISRE